MAFARESWTSTRGGTERSTTAPPVVLMVEDDFDARIMYARYLSDHGFRVETAADGMEALRVASASRPSVVVLDLSLPHINGWEVTRRLKRDPATRDTVVIACTGHLLGESVELALDAGCDAYVVKPCLPQDLTSEIHRALARQRSDRRGTMRP